MEIDFFCPAKVYGAEKIALKNPFISAEFDRILKHMESNLVLCTGDLFCGGDKNPSPKSIRKFEILYLNKR